MPTRERKLKEQQKRAQIDEAFSGLVGKAPSGKFTAADIIASAAEISKRTERYKLQNVKYDPLTGDPWGPVGWGKDGIVTIRKKKAAKTKKLRTLAGRDWGKVFKIPEIQKKAAAQGIPVSDRTLRRYFKEDAAESKILVTT